MDGQRASTEPCPSRVEPITYQIEFPKPFPPLTGRPATPEEVAQLVLFLASDSSSNITGGEFLIDAGVSLLRG